MATNSRGVIFPNPKAADPDGPMRWCKRCSRTHRTRMACPGVLVRIKPNNVRVFYRPESS